ncbi:hypothetical protein FXO38_05118 [Capsicum annuum]|nr:hypothetical protein FXO38_05118 [Capsicum annuum]
MTVSTLAHGANCLKSCLWGKSYRSSAKSLQTKAVSTIVHGASLEMSNAQNRGIVRGHYGHVNQIGHSFNTDTLDYVEHVYEEQSHHAQHSRQSNLHLYGNDLYDDTDKNHAIHDE